MPTSTDFTAPLDDRLASAGFELSTPFVHVRHDDVYETTVEQLVDGAWLAVIHNLTPDATGPPAKFRFTHDGTLLSTEGIDGDTVRAIYPDLVRSEPKEG